MWFVGFAMAGAPGAVEVRYTQAFDMDARGDQICSFTGICDCTATYVGSGRLVPTGADRMTYEGTWKVEQSSCNANFAIWTPADGKAWHTFRLAPGGAALTEWVVHGTAAGHARLSSGMKAAGQFWMNELASPWKGAGRHEIVQQDGGALAAGVRVTTTHTLAIDFTAP